VRNAFQLPDDIISLLTEAIGIVRTELERFPVRLRGNRGNLYPRAWSIIGIHDD
jgi:hypothetical protein